LSDGLRDVASDVPSDGLDEAPGARQAVSVVLPVLLDGDPDPDWRRGPLPFGTEQRPWDAERRGQYYAPAAARALYGRRWHRRLSVTEGPLELDGLELLRVATPREPRQALGILHFTVRGIPLPAVLRAIGYRPGAGPDPLTGALDPAALFGRAAAADRPAHRPAAQDRRRGTGLRCDGLAHRSWAHRS
jgi:hypothetical protein